MSAVPTVVVFGASAGIGRGIAVYLSGTKKYKIALLSRNIEKLKETQKLCQDRNPLVSTLILKCDITNNESVKSCMDKINNSFAPISIMINSAGTFYLNKIDSTLPIKEVNTQFDVDLKGMVYSCMYTMEYMKNTKKLYPFIPCSIIVISGRSATMRGLPPGYAMYGAVTCAKRGFMDVLYKECLSYGIKTCCIMPSTVNTSMTDSRYKYIQQAIQPNDVGQVIENIISTPHTCVPSEMILSLQYDVNEKSDVYNAVNFKLNSKL
eukprot:169454_1